MSCIFVYCGYVSCSECRFVCSAIRFCLQCDKCRVLLFFSSTASRQELTEEEIAQMNRELGELAIQRRFIKQICELVKKN